MEEFVSGHASWWQAGAVSSDEEQLRIRLRKDFVYPGLLEVQDAVVKAGPQVWKTAALAMFGDKATGEVKRRTLKVRAWVRSRARATPPRETTSGLATITRSRSFVPC